MEETAIRPSRKRDDEDGEEEGAGSFASLIHSIVAESVNGAWRLLSLEITDPGVKSKRIALAMQRLGVTPQSRWRDINKTHNGGAWKTLWGILHL